MGQEYVETPGPPSAAVWRVIHLHYFTASFIFQSNQLSDMAQNQFSKMTEEELKKRQKELTFAVVLMAIAVLVITFSAILSYSKKGFSTTTILPLLFTPLAISNLLNLKKLKSELSLRKS